jgi:hypothetical protein
MARYSAAWSNVTAAALADTTNTTDATYPGSLRGAGAAVLARINEVYIGGMETAASNATDMILARTSTISTGALTVGTNALVDVQSTAPGTICNWGNTIATTKAQRAATLYLLGLALNCYGGISRWQARVGEEITLFGNASNAGEVLLSAKTGTGKSSGHVLYEVV